MSEREVEEKRARRKGGRMWERELQKGAKGKRAMLCYALL